jgi:cytochrome oxidase Cu insertion factor (SCO1/SenC/PrrC family)
MRRRVRSASLAVIGGLVLTAMWLAPGDPAQRTGSGGAPPASASIDDLLMDLQLLPMDGRAPKPFSLEGLDGKRVTLGDIAGRPALLYFWATW